MDLTEVDVEPSEASEVGMEPSEATSKESYFASQAKRAELKERAKELVHEVLFDVVDTDSSGTIEKAEFVYMHTMVLNSEKRAAARVAEAKAAAPPCCMVM